MIRSLLTRPLRPHLKFQPLTRIAMRSIFIQTRTTPNANALKFELNPNDYNLTSAATDNESKTYEFLSLHSTFNNSYGVKSELAKNLFMNLGDVKGILVGPNFVTVECLDDMSLKKNEIFSMLTEYLTRGLPVIEPTENISAVPEEEKHNYTEDELETIELIQELIDTKIRPSIQEDGGDLEFVKYDPESGIVYIKLQGACRSCDSSEVTLKNGIENMLIHYIDDVNGVEQYMDETQVQSQKQLEKLEEKLKTKKEAEGPPAL